MDTRKPLLLAGLGLACVLALGLSGCGSGNSLGFSSHDVSDVRAFNALNNVPGNTDVDFRLLSSSPSAQTLATNLPEGQGSPYKLIQAGTSVPVFVMATNTSTVVAQGSPRLDPHTAGQNNGTFTLVAMGVNGQPSGSNMAPMLTRFIDNWPSASQIANVGNSLAGIRFINAAAGSTPLTLYNNAPPSPTAIPGLSGIVYGTSSQTTGSQSGIAGSSYFPIPAGTYTLIVRDTVGNTVATLNNATFSTGIAYTIIVYGVYPPASGTQLGITVLQDTNSL